MATWYPPYLLLDTEANPPVYSTSVAPFEQSGMCMELGITHFRPHNLQSSLRSFFRSSSDIVRFSRRYSSHYPLSREVWLWKERTWSISSTSLLVSESESSRDWRREASRGRKLLLLRCFPSVLVSGNFQLLRSSRQFEGLNYLS